MKLVLLSALMASAFVANADVNTHLTKTQSTTFKAMDDNLATQYCIAAATKGLNAVKQMAKNDQSSFIELKKTISCNGYSLTSFSEKFAESTRKSSKTITQAQVIKVLANDNSKESKLCVDALVLGEHAARQKHELPRTPIICNNMSLQDFVEEFKERELIVQTSELPSSTGQW